jgi:SAM-dependent methyltransferase
MPIAGSPVTAVPSSLQKASICARYVLRNLRSFVRERLHRHAGESGATHQSFSTEQSVAYVRQAFGDYLAYGGVSKDWLSGKRVLEIGPGDNLGVALLFAASGAQVVCLDRFETRSDAAQRRRVYETLRAGLTEPEQKLFDEAIDCSSLRLGPEKVRTVIGVPVEKADEALKPGSFDWIVSRAVLEEVSKMKLARCLAAQHRLLKPGGRMAHKIDLRDYRIFSSRGFHPLEYWTLPGWLHTFMSSHEPAPNRCRASQYRALLEQLGCSVETWVTHLAGTEAEIEPHWKQWPVDGRVAVARELVARIRPRLDGEFRSLDDEDLMAAGVFLLAQKRPGG